MGADVAHRTFEALDAPPRRRQALLIPSLAEQDSCRHPPPHTPRPAHQMALIFGAIHPAKGNGGGPVMPFGATNDPLDHLLDA